MCSTVHLMSKSVRTNKFPHLWLGRRSLVAANRTLVSLAIVPVLLTWLVGEISSDYYCFFPSHSINTQHKVRKSPSLPLLFCMLYLYSLWQASYQGGWQLHQCIRSIGKHHCQLLYLHVEGEQPMGVFITHSLSAGILWTEKLHSSPDSHEKHWGWRVGDDMDGEVCSCGGSLQICGRKWCQ